MLTASERHRPEDLELWAELESADLLHARTDRMKQMKTRALDCIIEFARKPSYASVSWGKDSVVLAHLVWQAISTLGRMTPLVWVRVEPIKNPECAVVRDAFLEQWASEYREIESLCMGTHAMGTLERGFKQAEAEFGNRHLSGVRGDESGIRKIRMRKWGPTTGKTCAPLIYWTAQDVFAYLAANGLPVHPAYAMLGGGRYDRRHLRVSSLGGKRGDGCGRAEWEREYYGDVLNRLGAI